MHVFGDFGLVGGAGVGFRFWGGGGGVGFHGVGELIETDEREGVAVDIAEACNGSSPDRRFFAEEHVGSADSAGSLCAFTCCYYCHCCILCRVSLVADTLEARRTVKADAALGPFEELGGDVFRDEDDLRGATDELVLFRIGLGSDERY